MNDIESLTRVVWNDEMRYIFIIAMLNETAKGTFTSSGFKKPGWNAVLVEFNARMNMKLTKAQLQNQYAWLKERWKIFKSIKDNSGFGWDEARSLPTAPDHVWEAYIKAHPEAARFRYETLKFYNELDQIFTGQVATGRYAISSTATSSLVAHDSQRGFYSSTNDSDSEGDEPVSIEPVVVVHSAGSGTATTPTVFGGTCCDLSVEKRKAHSSAECDKVKRVRRSALADVTNLLNKIIDNQTTAQSREPPLVQAMRLLEKYSDHLQDGKSLKVKRYFAENESQALLFLHLTDCERIEYLENCLYEY